MKYAALIRSIAEAHSQAQAGAAGAVNRHLILRNWLIGAYLVEFEQKGEDRAKYGEGLLKRVADDLKGRQLIGLGLSMLKDCRTIYRLYPQIRQPVVGELSAGTVLPIGQPPVGESGDEFACSSLASRSAKRLLQIGSLLYERTGLSTDKQAVIDAGRQQAVDVPQLITDLIRDPYVLEFPGLTEKSHYLESDLEK